MSVFLYALRGDTRPGYISQGGPGGVRGGQGAPAGVRGVRGRAQKLALDPPLEVPGSLESAGSGSLGQGGAGGG